MSLRIESKRSTSRTKSIPSATIMGSNSLGLSHSLRDGSDLLSSNSVRSEHQTSPMRLRSSIESNDKFADLASLRTHLINRREL